MTRKSGRSCPATAVATTSPRATFTKKGSLSPNKRGSAKVAGVTTNGNDDEDHHSHQTKMTKVIKLNGIVGEGYNNENSPTKDSGHHHLRSKKEATDGADENISNYKIGNCLNSNNSLIGEKRLSLSPQPVHQPPTPSPLYKVIDKSMSYTKSPSSQSTNSHHNHRSPSVGGPLSPGSASLRDKRITSPVLNVQKTPPITTPKEKGRKRGRPRQTELTLLNNEAENFMFPKVKEEQLNYDSDASDIILIVNGKKQILSCGKNGITGKEDVEKAMARIKNDLGGGSSKPTPAAARGGSKETVLPLKKRISNQNKSYCATRVSQRKQKVKLEEEEEFYDEFSEEEVIPKQRKKPSKPKQVKVEPVVKEEPIEEFYSNLTKIIQNEEVSSFKFAFERVPSTEPWFAAFQRQDEGEERVFEYYGSTNYKKLPYEMGPLPALPPDCCHLSQLPMTPSKTKKAVPSQAGVQTGADPIPKRVVCSPRITQMRNKLKKEVVEKTTTTAVVEESVTKVATIERKRKLLADLEHPRKSPREHASTLAILSCLLQQKKKDSEGEMSSHNSETMSERRDSHFEDFCESSEVLGTDDLETIESEKNVENVASCSKKVSKAKRKSSSSSSRSSRKRNRYKKGLDTINVKQLNREIESLLTDPLNESVESIDLKLLDKSDEFLAPFRQSPDLKDLFMTVDEEQPHLRKSFSTKKTTKPINRTILQLDYHLRNTKKRKNRTGWPTNKRRISAKRDSHKSGTGCSPEEGKLEEKLSGQKVIKQEPLEEIDEVEEEEKTASDEEKTSPILRKLLSPNKSSEKTGIINNNNVNKKLENGLENEEEPEDYDSISDSISVLVSDDPDTMTSDGVRSPSITENHRTFKQIKISKFFAKKNLISKASQNHLQEDVPLNGVVVLNEEEDGEEEVESQEHSPVWPAAESDSKSLVLLKDKNGITKLNCKLFEPIISIKRVETSPPIASVKCGPSSYRLRSSRAGRRKRRKKRI